MQTDWSPRIMNDRIAETFTAWDEGTCNCFKEKYKLKLCLNVYMVIFNQFVAFYDSFLILHFHPHIQISCPKPFFNVNKRFVSTCTSIHLTFQFISSILKKLAPLFHFHNKLLVWSFLHQVRHWYCWNEMKALRCTKASLSLNN